MTVTLEQLAADAALAPLPRAFGEMIGRLDGDADGLVALAAALVSDQAARGHVCLDLAGVDRIALGAFEENEGRRRHGQWPDPAAWAAKLSASRAVRVREGSDRAENLDRPLVFDAEGQRLYLARYWFYQQRLAGMLASRIRAPSLAFDERKLRADIERLFPDRKTEGGFDQCVAAANAVDRHFSIITGGPGTGKTTTVAKLLALRLLQPRPDASARPLNVLLMAPTGKAAQRLNEALGRATKQMDLDPAIRTQLEQVKAGTIHRLLGWTAIPPEKGGPFRHHEEFPLDADVVLVDEGSMVDLSLMWRLFSAVQDDAQIILMGDRDQLASVEAGGILADLCGDSAALDIARMPAGRREVISRRTGLELPTSDSGDTAGLSASIVQLHYSHRFDPSSALGRLASNIRAGNEEAVIETLRKCDGETVVWIPPGPARESLGPVIERAAEHYAGYLDLLASGNAAPARILAALNRFRILCAHREGRWGEANLNRRVAERLAAEGRIVLRFGHYAGRPLLVTRNDYRRELFNGDVGVVVPASTGAGNGFEVLFEQPSAQDGVRRVPASLLPEAKECFAMTIYKSQGSEFHRVLVVLPPEVSPILTRELLYTAVTRVCGETDESNGARKAGQLCVVGSEKIIRAAVRQRIRRNSGLRDAIAAAG